MGRSTFVGRVEALRSLGEAAAAAASGTPQVVLVEGSAGMGKSSLLTAFRHRLHSASVLAASGDEVETSLEFGVVQQLLDTEATWSDPFVAGAAFLQHLGQLAKDDRAVVIVVDDAHLCDLPSLRTLGFAMRRLRADPVLLVLALRLESERALPAALTHGAEDSGIRIALEGLTETEIQELAKALGTGPLTHRAAKRLRSHTAGSPLHLRALLDELPLQTLEAVDRPLPAPRSFALLVLHDLAAASQAARRMVSAAAVMGDRAELRDVLAVADIGTELTVPVLEELHQLQILLLPAGHDRVRFPHPLVRAAVYDDLGPGARIQLHQRAAQVLSGPASLRHRVAAAVGPDPELAGDLERAGDAQERVGHLSAAADAWLLASRLSDTGTESGRRLLRGVGLLLASGDVAAALSHAGQLEALAPSGPGLHVQARIAWLTGRADDAVQLGRRAWKRKSEMEPEERDQLAATLAQIEMLRDRGTEAAGWAATALEGDLDQNQAPLTRAIRANALTTAGQPQAALAVLSDLPTNPRDVDPRRHPELTARGILRGVEGDLAKSEADLVVAGSLSYGDLSPFRLTARGTLATVLFRAGKWTLAHVVAEEVVSLAMDMEQGWLAGYMHATAALVPSGRGDWKAAQNHVDAAQAMASLAQETATAAYADDAAIYLATCRDQPAEVIRLAHRRRHYPNPTPREPGLLTWPVHLVSALVKVHSLDEAEDELAVLEESAHRRAHPSRLAAAARLRGQLADARRHHDDARTSFETAIALGGAGVDADERAMAHLAYGSFLRRRGERRAAVEHLTQAGQRYDRLGAAPFIARCDVLLTACGASPNREAVSTDPLTPQERAVATLAASGRTNQQAADELVLSVKTISYHLQNVYTKLGVHSRVQLAAHLAGRGVT
jgi:DNA-binding CsgD family transcriptional regulator